MTIVELHPHPAAELFPMMTGADFDALMDDIKQHGQREPIIVIGDAILDGRNRYAACLRLGVEPKIKEWDGKQTPEEFVASMNLHRRHLNSSQRGMIAARLVTATVGRPKGNNPELGNLTIRKAGELLGVSKGTMDNSRTVLANATDDEIAAVDRGEVAVDTLAKQIREKLPPKEREARRNGGSMHPGIAARIEQQRLDSLQWQQLKQALLVFGNFPRAADVVPVVRKMDRSQTTDKYLIRALNWLEAFANEWTKHG